MKNEILTQTMHGKMAPKGGKDSTSSDGFSSAMKEAWYFLTNQKKKKVNVVYTSRRLHTGCTLSL